MIREDSPIIGKMDKPVKIGTLTVHHGLIIVSLVYQQEELSSIYASPSEQLMSLT